MAFLTTQTRYLFFTGKGGVGKTSMSCATGLALAEAGKKVLIVSTDPASNLDEVLGVALGQQPVPVPSVPGLCAMNIDPEAAARAYRERMVAPYRGILPDAAIHSMEEQFSGACTVEIAAFDEFSKLLGDPAITADFDHVIFDTAPTGHTLRLLTLPRFWALVFFVIGTCIYGVYDQQFPVYFSSQFPTLQEGNAMYGYLNSFQVFLEAAGMFCAPWLVNRIGAKNGLIFAGMVMAMRMVASGLVEGPLLISITKLLHAVELPVLLVSIFKYNSLNFDKRLSSTLYLVGFACTSSVIATVLSPLAGYSYEKYGFAQSYLIMGLLVFCTTFISIFLLRSSKSSSDPLMPQTSAI